MPDQVDATASPVPVDTTSAPITGQLAAPAPAAQPSPQSVQPAQAVQAAQTLPNTPQTPQPPGSFFRNLSHSFTGAILGSMANREKITSYNTDETGKQTPVTTQQT